jgi:hypothetical protein
MAGNPYIAAFLCWHEAFQQVVNPDEDAEGPESGSAGVGGESNVGAAELAEAALQYCIREIAVWVDAEGATEWVMAHMPEGESEYGCCVKPENINSC